ncbi:MAG: DUF2461 family protein [Acidimicrobiia bacterium]|nr:DUF2461 family protein [Acidimicrobiia bacterium]
MNEFDGFPIEGLDFLRELGDRDKAWFDANRATYQASVVAPTKTFVEAVGKPLAAGFAPARATSGCPSRTGMTIPEAACCDTR